MPDGGAGGARACLQGLSASELEVVAEAASILAGVHVARVEDLSALHREAMRVLRLEHPAGCGDASPLSPSSRLARAAEILPDLVQVHNTIIRVAGRCQRSVSSLMDAVVATSTASCMGDRKWMFYLMPIWDDKKRPPLAREFWHAAHAVARDHSGDDWIAPHVTLHSRSPCSVDLAEAFSRFLGDLSPESWRELLDTLTTPENWILDPDEGPDAVASRPSNQDHFTLHKAKVHFPEAVKSWLTQNQDQVAPRKQDKHAQAKLPEHQSINLGDKVPVTQPFHISLYSFRASRDSSMSDDNPVRVPSTRSVSRRTRSEEAIAQQPLLNKRISYVLHVPTEDSLRRDLADAMWMFVLCSPGRTGQHAMAPLVLGAVPLSSLASGSFDCGGGSSAAGGGGRTA